MTPTDGEGGPIGSETGPMVYSAQTGTKGNGAKDRTRNNSTTYVQEFGLGDRLCTM